MRACRDRLRRGGHEQEEEEEEEEEQLCFVHSHSIIDCMAPALVFAGAATIYLCPSRWGTQQSEARMCAGEAGMCARNPS